MAGRRGAMRDVKAEAALTPERLAAQQAQIARRLEALERRPASSPSRRPPAPSSAGNSHVRRWVAVAAAAGLIAGIGLGQMMDIHRSFERRDGGTAVRSSHRSRRCGPTRSARSVSHRDEDILERRGCARAPARRGPRALDDLTPHARDDRASEVT